MLLVKAKKFIKYLLIVGLSIVCLVSLWMFIVYLSYYHSHNKPLLTEGEENVSSNNLPELSESIDFYYSRSKHIDDGTFGHTYGNFQQPIDIVRAEHISNEIFSNTIYKTDDNIIDDVYIGNFGQDSVVNFIWDKSIVVLNGSESGDNTHVVYKDKPEGTGWIGNLVRYPRERKQFFFKIFNKNTDQAEIGKYDFNKNKWEKLHFPEDSKPESFIPIYFDSPKNRLLMVPNIDYATQGLFLYSYNIGRRTLERLAVHKENGKEFEDNENYYYFHDVSDEGIILYSEFSSRYGEPIAQYALDLRVNSQTSAKVSLTAKKLPGCGEGGMLQAVLISPDSSAVFCESVVLDKVSGESLSPSDYLFGFHYKREIVNLDTMETKMVGLFRPDRLSFLEFAGLKSLGYTSQSAYFFAFGYKKYLNSQSRSAIAWLDDNRFLTLETNDDGTQNLYVEDFRGDKTLVDSGWQEYQYLGSYNNK